MLSGVKAFDKESGKYYNFRSKIVINAAGPWCRELANHFDKDYKDLFKSSIAWNLFLNKKALSSHASGSYTETDPMLKHIFYAHGKECLFAGTIHEPWSGMTKNPIPSENSINNFINDLNTLVLKI